MDLGATESCSKGLEVFTSGCQKRRTRTARIPVARAARTDARRAPSRPGRIFVHDNVSVAYPGVGQPTEANASSATQFRQRDSRCAGDRVAENDVRLGLLQDGLEKAVETVDVTLCGRTRGRDLPSGRCDPASSTRLGQSRGRRGGLRSRFVRRRRDRGPSRSLAALRWRRAWRATSAPHLRAARIDRRTPPIRSPHAHGHL